MRRTQRPETEHNGFTSLHVSKVALLTTFRRNGQGVQTPVGIRFAGGNVYFTTWSTTGKVKRLARNPRVTLAAVLQKCEEEHKEQSFAVLLLC